MNYKIQVEGYFLSLDYMITFIVRTLQVNQKHGPGIFLVRLGHTDNQDCDRTVPGVGWKGCGTIYYCRTDSPLCSGGPHLLY